MLTASDATEIAAAAEATEWLPCSKRCVAQHIGSAFLTSATVSVL